MTDGLGAVERLAALLWAAPLGSHVVCGDRAWLRVPRGYMPVGCPGVDVGPSVVARAVGADEWVLVARGRG